MLDKIYNAIADLSNRFAESQKKLNEILDAKCVRNSENIAETNENLVLAEQAITDMDIRNIETEQTITDLDIRLMGLEA